MKIARESLFISILRSFFISFFAIFGVIVAFAIAALIFSGKSDSQKAPSHYNASIVPSLNTQNTTLNKNSPLILQINIDGFIGSNELNNELIKETLFESQHLLFEKGRVKALLLNINSPGGGAITSYNIYKTIKNYKELFQVPVYAYVDGLAASGGYQIACAADKIYASEVSLIGSVGVVINLFNVSELMKTIGIKSATLTQGKDKDLMNPFRPWKENEDAPLKEITKFYYTLFLDIVTTNRKQLTEDNLVNTYGANIFPAPKALEYNYIDKSNVSWEETISDLALQADIYEEKYQVIELNKKHSIFDIIGINSWLWTGKVNHTFPQLPAQINSNIDNQILYLYQHPSTTSP